MSNPTININYGAWTKIARGLADSAGLTVRYVDQEDIDEMGAEAWTSGRTIFVRQPSNKWPTEVFNLWLYFFIHEIGHCTTGRRHSFELLMEEKPTGLLRYVWNLLEDDAQERELYRSMPVLRNYLSHGRKDYLEYQIGGWGDEQMELAEKNPQGPTLFGWDTQVRRDFMPALAGYEHHFWQPVRKDPRVQEWIKRLQDGDYADVLKNNPSCQDIMDLAKRIVREVFDEDPDTMNQQQQQQSGGQGEEGEKQDGDGEQQQGSDGGEDDTGQPQGGEESEEGGDGEESKCQGKVDYDWLMNHSHEIGEGGESQSSHPGGGLEIDYEKYFEDGRTYREFHPRDDYKVYNTFDGQWPRHNNGNRTAVPESSLTKKVARYLQAKTRSRRIYAQKKGNLSNKSLYKLRVKGMGQEQRSRIFHQKIVNTSKDVAVSVLVDMSGSMSGRKTNCAIAACTHLHEVVNALHIPLEVLGFSETDVGEHVVIQSFKRKVKTDQVTRALQRTLPFNGSNADGEAIVWAYERLMKQKASRRLLIVLSDGQPASCRGDLAAYTKQVVEAIERCGQCEVYGIGIQSRSVEHFYKEHAIIQRPEELESKLLSVLKNNILNHL